MTVKNVIRFLKRVNQDACFKLDGDPNEPDFTSRPSTRLAALGHRVIRTPTMWMPFPPNLGKGDESRP